MTHSSSDKPAPTVAITTTVNGTVRQLVIEPRETLADVLRRRLGLTGVKLSCDVQVCGACTVLVDGLPVSGCTFLAYEARGRAVLTVEGLAPSRTELHPIQQAFIDENAFQCGFCTPGMLLATKALLDEQPDASEAEIVEYLDGNLCRCTGYKPILAAVVRARDTLRAMGNLPSAPTDMVEG